MAPMPAVRRAPPPPAPPKPKLQIEHPEPQRIESSQPPPPRLIETPMEGITRLGDDVLEIDKQPLESLEGLESTRIEDSDGLGMATPAGSLLDVDPTANDPLGTTSMDLIESTELGPVDSTPIEQLQTVEKSSIDSVAQTPIDFIEVTPIDSTQPTGVDSVEPIPIDAIEAMPVDGSPAEPSRAMDYMPEETAAREADALDFVMPDPEPVGGRDSELLDFGSALGTPDSSMPSVADESASASTRDLPFMDFSLPRPVIPTSPRSGTPIENLSVDADLVIDANTMPEFDGSEESDDVLTIDDDDLVITSTPSVAHPSTTVAVHSVEVLKASVEREPDNWTMRRELAEAMLDAGDRDGGIRELEITMSGAERGGDLDLASSLAEEIARLEPEVVRHHQKRVEYAFRTNDRARLIDAYLALADSLLWSNQPDKARTVYQRVLDLAPDEVRAQSALQTITPAEPTPAISQPAAPRRPSAPMPSPAPRSTSEEELHRSFVNLGDWLRDEQAPKDTRMVVAEQEPTGDEEADFADMLRKFKQGVAENVDAEDYQSHYDLAIAYKEMGLLDEAIAEFQKALGSPTTRLPTYEALGQCFLDKGQFKLASSILSRALSERASEDQLLGVLYLLGRAAEAQGQSEEALGYYQRVFVLDIQFRDIADRMSELERVAR